MMMIKVMPDDVVIVVVLIRYRVSRGGGGGGEEGEKKHRTFGTFETKKTCSIASFYKRQLDGVFFHCCVCRLYHYFC